MELSLYLDRIKYGGTVEPTFETLAALQEAHVNSVPFENLDVQLGRPLSTCIEDAYEKMVCRSRGGWCYEQNGLFGWALTEIGFDVTRIAASVMREKKGAASKDSHLCLLVTTPESGRRYLADVGFGGSMVRPIPLREGQYDQAPFTVGLQRLDDRYWQYWEDPGDGKFSFDFMDEPASESSLAEKSEHLQHAPESNFVLNLVAQQRTGDQHRILRGRVFSVSRPAGTKSKILNSAEELVSILAHEFQLDVPEVADLWPRITARHEKLFGRKSSVD